LDYNQQYWNYKSVRDPLYGFIHLSEREAALIGTTFMHRLTRIKQLAHTYLVYPSAVHTRFEHSLGVLHMADRLSTCYNIGGERREVIRCAALLHDVGHGPFSHLFENVLVKVNGSEFSHEDVTRAIISNDEDISSILEGKITTSTHQNPSDIRAKVLLLLSKESNEKDPLGRSIISGTIDADKLDYLRRDSYHTGSTYGMFDLERMLSTLRVVQDNGKEYPAILEKGTPVLESFRLARYLLYIQVYQHHTRVVADRMFLRSLELAIFAEKKIPEDKFKFKGREKEFITDYFSLDDSSIYELVLSSCKGNASIAFEILNDLKNRRLFKRSYARESGVIPAAKRIQVWKTKEADLEKEIATASGVPASYVIAHKESEEGGLSSYKSFGSVAESGDIPMLYIDRDGKAQPYEDRSPISLRKEPSQILYIFTKKAFQGKVSEICKQKFC
jgi:hypothetical protein